MEVLEGLIKRRGGVVVSIKPVDAWTRAEAAAVLLCGVSPWLSDGGHLIRRDPWKVSAADYAAVGFEAAPLLRVIRAKCMDCCVEQESEVRKCVQFTCANWPYRMGFNPFRSRELTDEQRAAASERGRALHRAWTNSGLINTPSASR